MQALVRGVRPGVGILDAGDQYRRGGELLGEGRDERDRTPAPQSTGSLPQACAKAARAAS